MAARWRPGRYLRVSIITILGLSTLLILLQEAEGALDITEEWIIDEGETVTVENETLNLYRNIWVYGRLELYNSSLNIHETEVGIHVGSQGDMRMYDVIFNSIFDFYSYYPSIRVNDTARVLIDGARIFSSGFRVYGIDTSSYPTVTLNEVQTMVPGGFQFYNLNLTIAGLASNGSSIYLGFSSVRIEDSVISGAPNNGLDIYQSQVEMDNVSLYGNGLYGFRALNSTVDQNDMHYLDPRGEGPNEWGQYTVERYLPVRVRYGGERMGAEGNLTDASGASSMVHLDDGPDTIRMVIERVTYSEPQELFPYTLRLSPTFSYYIEQLPAASLTHVLDGFPEAPLELVIPGDLDLDIEFSDLGLPHRFYELEDTPIYVTILNNGTSTVRDLPVTLKVTNSSSASGQVYFYDSVDNWVLTPGGQATYRFTISLRSGPHALNISIGDVYLGALGFENVSVTQEVKVLTQIDKYKAQEEGSIHPGVYLLLVLLALMGCLGVYYQFRHIQAVDDRKMRRFEDDLPRAETGAVRDLGTKTRDHSYRPGKGEGEGADGSKEAELAAGSGKGSQDAMADDGVQLFECPRCQGEVPLTDVEDPIRCPSCGMTGDTEPPAET